MIGQIHLWAAAAALITGGVVVLLPKGVGHHKLIGRLYFFSMVVTLTTAMSIYDLFGGFGPFHVAAIISSASIIGGIIPAWRRKRAKHWFVSHAMWMSWSYIGLCAAAVSEISTRYLNLSMGPTVAIATSVVVLIGYVVVRVRMRVILSRFGFSFN